MVSLVGANQSSALRGNGAAESEAAMERKLEVGGHVKVVDVLGVEHDALVTVVWNSGHTAEKFREIYSQWPSLNVLYVSGDENKNDQYGRQIERDLTSLCHRDVQNGCPGRYWFFPDETRR